MPSSTGCRRHAGLKRRTNARNSDRCGYGVWYERRSRKQYPVDGIAEDIITALAHYPSLFVTARNSSFAYKSRSVDVRRMGHEVGARYLLGGSVRTLGNHLRVTVQLIEAATGKHVRAERYDRKMADRLAAQDKISKAISIRAAGVIAAAERQRALRVARRRRAEREIIELAFQEPITPAVIRYINRVSDLLFVLARVENGSGAGDVLWHPGAGREPASPPTG
jgi:TolB-like protein